jgi:hypothetical protein
LREEKSMVIRWLNAAIATHEGPYRRSGSQFNFVGSQESEALLVPFLRSPEVRNIQHRMAQAKDMRRPLRQAHCLANPRTSRCVVVGTVCKTACWCSYLLAGDNFYKEPVRVGETHDLPASWIIERLNGEVFRLCQGFEVFRAFRAQAQRLEGWVTCFGGVQERATVASLAIQASIVFGAGQAEILKESLHLAQVWRRKPNMRDVFDLDDGHHACIPFIIDYLVNYFYMTF